LSLSPGLHVSALCALLVGAQPVLPDAPERQLVVQHCLACHDVTRIESAGGSRSGWTRRIERMIMRGSTLPPKDVPEVAAYLARALPVRLAASSAHAGGIRERMRLPQSAATTVNESQATDLTLTVTPVGEQNIQTWVRTAGTIDAPGKIVTTELNAREGTLVQVGQRARAFQVTSRSLMNQARITRVTPRGDGVLVEATLTAVAPNRDAPYLLEIVVDRGRFLAVPNAAIIEEGDRHVVYVQHHPGAYMPMEIHTGIQGELYTQVLHGLDPGDEVVTFGSFFVDAEYKLKSSGASAATPGHEHHHH